MKKYRRDKNVLVQDGLMTARYNIDGFGYIVAQVLRSTPRGVLLDRHRIHVEDEEVLAILARARYNPNGFYLLGQQDGSGKKVGDHSSPFFDGTTETGWECLGGPVLIVRKPGQQLRIVQGNLEYLNDLSRDILMSMPKAQSDLTRLQICHIGCTNGFRRRFEVEMGMHIPPSGYGTDWKILLAQNIKARDLL